MGICAHKKDQEEANPPSFSLLPQLAYNPREVQLLVDTKKASHVPFLSLAANPLYLKRLEALKPVDSSSDRISQIQTLDQKLETA